jgi:hypothetical protein
MHQLNVLILGPNSFTATLIELKSFLKFNLHEGISKLNDQRAKFDILIFHKDFIANNQNKNILTSNGYIRILASNESDNNINYDAILKLPTTLNEINSLVESLAAKKIFNKNSSIQIKEYLLDKNEKKLIKMNNFVILTEKEIQLLEIFLKYNEPLSKKKILSSVWSYASDADTHTVETHIYRLRKKINDKFSDENFILNNKDGYYV